MTLHEIHTHLEPSEVIDRARSFFTHAATPYAAFAEQEGEGYLKLHLEVAEIVIAALPRGDTTWVRGSASRGGHLLTHFLTTLAFPMAAKQTVHRHGLRRTWAAQVESPSDRTSTPAPSEAGTVPQAA